MNHGMKMLAVTSLRDRQGNDRRNERNRMTDMNYPRSDYDVESRYRDGGSRSEYEGRDYTRNEYNGSEMNYGGVEGRFRDRRGREHYDNGRFAPMRNNGDDDMEMRRTMEMRGTPYIPPIYDRGGDRMNQIGFRMNEMGGNYRMASDYPHMDELERHSGGAKSSGYAMGEEVAPFDKTMATEWTSRMKNEDGKTGPHWTMEQTKQVMAQKGVNVDPYEFFAAINAMYSGYGKVFKKHGVGDKLDLYVDMAKAFIEDKDAQSDKLSRYYQYVVKH